MLSSALSPTSELLKNAAVQCHSLILARLCSPAGISSVQTDMAICHCINASASLAVATAGGAHQHHVHCAHICHGGQHLAELEEARLLHVRLRDGDACTPPPTRLLQHSLRPKPWLQCQLSVPDHVQILSGTSVRKQI